MILPDPGVQPDAKPAVAHAASTFYVREARRSSKAFLNHQTLPFNYTGTDVLPAPFPPFPHNHIIDLLLVAGFSGEPGMKIHATLGNPFLIFLSSLAILVLC